MDNITKDPAYNAVDPHDFPAMLNPRRYGERSTAFDKIISATHDHFWDPLDSKYIDFTQPFDLTKEYVFDPKLNGDLKTAIGDALDEAGKIKLANLDALWSLSSILHGERCATSCAIRAPRNTPPTRRARKRDTSRGSRNTSRRAGASRRRSGRRWRIC
jgi:hypothetical protein